jgi:selenocysteine-specific elongation factor
VDQVYPGSRTAVNLSGVDVRSLDRGDVVTLPDTYKTTTMIDVQYRHLSDVATSLKHDQQVKLFIGSDQTMARVRLLQKETIKAGEHGWIQLVLDEPIVGVRADHYIIRRPSPGATLGGGRIADPHPRRRHRLKDIQVIERLEKMLQGSPGDILSQVLLKSGPIKLKDAIAGSGLSEQDAVVAIEELTRSGAMRRMEAGEVEPDANVFVVHVDVKYELHERIIGLLSEFHRLQPLRYGMLKEELRSRSNLKSDIFILLIDELVEQDKVKELGIRIAIADYEPALTESQKQSIDGLMKKFMRSKFSPPSVKESVSEVGEDLFTYLNESEQLIKVSADVLFEKKTYDQMVARIREELKTRGTISVAEVRDIFQTSRKYALALMEHLDQIKVTRRDGDVRRLVG